MPSPPRTPFRRRSRAVAWAKLLLPLAALALLSTVFLLARGPAGPVEIPYARLEAIARDPGLDRPRLAGVASDGTALALSADRVAPRTDAPGTWSLEAPRLEAAGPGGRLDLAAPAGEVDPAARRLALSGGVRIATSAGLAIATPDATADLREGTLATGPVTATGPLGDLAAGALAVRRDGAGARLVFTGGVRMLYRPGSASRPSPTTPAATDPAATAPADPAAPAPPEAP